MFFSCSKFTDFTHLISNETHDIKMIKILNFAKYNLTNLMKEKKDLYSLLFFVLLLVCVFPITLSPNLLVLSRISVGIYYIIVIFICMNISKDFLKKESIFGQFEIYQSKPLVLNYLIFGKWISFWGFFFLPCVLLGPCFLFLYGSFFSLPQLISMLFLLILTTFALGYMSIVGSIASMHSTQNDFLISFFYIPFYFPLLIFSSNSLESIIRYDEYFSLSFFLFCIVFIFAFFSNTLLILQVLKKIE